MVHAHLDKGIAWTIAALIVLGFISTFQPIIIMPAGRVAFWCGMIVPDAATIAKSYARLGKADATQVFPLRFESAVPLKCGAVKGQIPGFLVLVDFKTMQTRVVQ